MKVSLPIAVSLPPGGVCFAESAHAQDFSMRPRSDAYHKLLYVLRGQVSYIERDRDPERIGQGAVLLVPARIRHHIVDEHASTLLLLCVSEEFLRLESELDLVFAKLCARGRRQLALSGSARRALEHLWRRALLERNHALPAGGAMARALALQAFVLLARSPTHRPDESASARVLSVAREVETGFFECWTLDAAAARAGMSRRHFSGHFRAAIGRTFWEHLTDVRLTHAAQLLQRGEHSVTGVIFACGFGDVSQFYRLFRARFGEAPGAWAEQHRASNDQRGNLPLRHADRAIRD